MTTQPPITVSTPANPSAGRRKIELLPEGIINKIAAGEVVERPASVVKELLENSLDAGATRLQIAIENGGRTLIRISDNGSGIPPDEAPLAFAQHATSKIKTIDDLFLISTMGFRGEALASIASVSHTLMMTRVADHDQGIRIEVHDAVVSPSVPCAAPVGTTLEIRDLFYSVPARRKFMRSDSTEFGHIHEMVLRIALPNPQVAISLTHNGRTVLDLPITSDHRARVAAALDQDLHAQLLPIDFDERGIRVTGFAGQPSLARATAKFQYVFLNGRFIRDRSILHALKEAYRGLIEPSSQPVAVLFVQMDPAAFDVNVHPQKTEVRFRDSSGPYSVVLAAVRERLLASDLTPGMVVKPRMNPQGYAPPSSLRADSTVANLMTGGPSLSSAEENRKIIADFFKQAPAPQTTAPLDFSRPSPAVPSAALPPLDDHTLVASITQNIPPLSELDPTHAALLGPAPTELPNNSAVILAGATGVPSKFIQLHNTYIVVETPEGLLILDQHALHERIIYQELLDRVTHAPLEGQRLLLPEILPVTPRQQAALEIVQPLLADLGIEVAPFDAQTIAVHTFPSLLSKVIPHDFLRELLDKILELGTRISREELLHEVLDMASCKAAVKAGYPLSHDEIAALLARREQTERASNCPHGRPTTLRMTIYDLERQFKRK